MSCLNMAAVYGTRVGGGGRGGAAAQCVVGGGEGVVVVEVVVVNWVRFVDKSCDAAESCTHEFVPEVTALGLRLR